MARSIYDIVIIGDLRLPGATGRAVAEEIRAQARGGYRTA
jgi:CheY-like chemotaxis protein